MTSYRLSPHETVTVVSSAEACLHVRGEYAPGGRPPPMHWHPAQTERFRIVSGTLRLIVDGQLRDVTAGDDVTIAARTPHRMWNAARVMAEVEWFTEPAGRTQEWFALVSRDNPLTLLAGLVRYRDVFRLSLRSR
jgi:mannose-6-phosphate isomerase-like protein (cupin superfamily)